MRERSHAAQHTQPEPHGEHGLPGREQEEGAESPAPEGPLPANALASGVALRQDATRFSVLSSVWWKSASWPRTWSTVSSR